MSAMDGELRSLQVLDVTLDPKGMSLLRAEEVVRQKTDQSHASQGHSYLHACHVLHPLTQLVDIHTGLSYTAYYHIVYLRTCQGYTNEGQ